MNKKELVKRVGEKLDGLPQKTAVRAVDAVFESIAEGLQEEWDTLTAAIWKFPLQRKSVDP